MNHKIDAFLLKQHRGFILQALSYPTPQTQEGQTTSILFTHTYTFMGIGGEKTVWFWNGKQLKHIVGQTKKKQKGGIYTRKRLKRTGGKGVHAISISSPSSHPVNELHDVSVAMA